MVDITNNIHEINSWLQQIRASINPPPSILITTEHFPRDMFLTRYFNLPEKANPSSGSQPWNHLLLGFASNTKQCLNLSLSNINPLIMKIDVQSRLLTLRFTVQIDIFSHELGNHNGEPRHVIQGFTVMPSSS